MTASLTTGQLCVSLLLRDGGDDIGTGMLQLLLLPRASQAAPPTAATSKAAGKAGEGAQPGPSGPSEKPILGRTAEETCCSLLLEQLIKGRTSGICCILRADFIVRDAFS